MNAKDRAGSAPLHYAIAKGVSVVSALIAAGADVNAKNDDDDTPLHRAADMDILLLPLC